jgi:hypothetical protein
MTNELQDLALNSAHIHVCAESRRVRADVKKIIFAVVWLIMLEKTEEAHP